jgi:hypothetical protein
MNSSSPESPLPPQEMLQTILQPLLDDFQYWLGRSQDLLESHTLHFMEPGHQSDLLSRIQNAQHEVSAAQVLVHAMGGQAILELSVVTAWHQLVTECWKVAIQYRQQQANPS